MDYSAIGYAIQALDMDTPFTIGATGSVAPAPGWYAPTVTHDGTDDATIEDYANAWRFVSAGMTGQYGYSGPMLHPSEFVGAGIAERLTDGHDAGTVFACVVVEGGPEEDYEPVGWAIVAAVESFPGYARVCGACACLIANGDASGDAFADDPEWRGKALDAFLTGRGADDIVITPVGVTGSPDDWPEDAGQTRTDAPCDVCGESDGNLSPTLNDALTRRRR